MIGVLALQGDFIEHVYSLQKLGYSTKEVRTINDIKQVAGLIMPGGESTVIGKLLINTGLANWIKNSAKNGFPVYGTCAGCILLAKQVDSDYSLKLIDIAVQRNAYGRQLDSFETNLSANHFKNIPVVFIRAPKILHAGKNVTILLKHNNSPVLVREKNILAGTFHPELTNNLSVHRYFGEMTKTYSAHS
ncbi:MAG: pyridoxal 5'-phosphate synthase glutaminase subunit PdxT [Patescibacteria group bacterium]|jgi:5'-phosphate synthase pdxT subunit